MTAAICLAALVAWCFVIPGVMTNCLPRWLFVPAIGLVGLAMAIAP